jgi:TP901 family phage tail tape measure protein
MSVTGNPKVQIDIVTNISGVQQGLTAVKGMVTDFADSMNNAQKTTQISPTGFQRFTTSAANGLKYVDKFVESLGWKMRWFGWALQSVGFQLTAMGGAAVAALVPAILKTAEFEKVLTEVGVSLSQNAAALSTMPYDEFLGSLTNVSDEIKSIALEWGIMPTEAAKAFQSAIKTGLDFNKATILTSAALQLAKVTGEDLNTVVTRGAGLMNAYGVSMDTFVKKAKEALTIKYGAGNFTDQMVNDEALAQVNKFFGVFYEASQHSTATLDELMTSSAWAAKAFKAFGMTYEDAAAIIARASSTELSANVVGRELSSMFEKLVANSSDYGSEVRNLITIMEGGTATMADLYQIMNVLQKQAIATGNADQWWADNFGTDAGRMVATLMDVNDAGQQNLYTAHELAVKLKTEGSAAYQAAADKIKQTLSMQLDRLKASIQLVGITLGTALTPKLTEFINQLMEILNNKDVTKMINDIGKGLSEGLFPALTNVVPMLHQMMVALTQTYNALVPWLQGIMNVVDGFVSLLAQLPWVGSLFQSLSDILKQINFSIVSNDASGFGKALGELLKVVLIIGPLFLGLGAIFKMVGVIIYGLTFPINLLRDLLLGTASVVNVLKAAFVGLAATNIGSTIAVQMTQAEAAAFSFGMTLRTLPSTFMASLTGFLPKIAAIGTSWGTTLVGKLSTAMIHGKFGGEAGVKAMLKADEAAVISFTQTAEASAAKVVSALGSILSIAGIAAVVVGIGYAFYQLGLKMKEWRETTDVAINATMGKLRELKVISQDTFNKMTTNITDSTRTAFNRIQSVMNQMVGKVQDSYKAMLAAANQYVTESERMQDEAYGKRKQALEIERQWKLDNAQTLYNEGLMTEDEYNSKRDEINKQYDDLELTNRKSWDDKYAAQRIADLNSEADDEEKVGDTLKDYWTKLMASLATEAANAPPMTPLQEQNWKTMQAYVKAYGTGMEGLMTTPNAGPALKAAELALSQMTTDNFEANNLIVQNLIANLPTKQAGGVINKTGPYILHAGEFVVPKQSAPNIVLPAQRMPKITMPQQQLPELAVATSAGGNNYTVTINLYGKISEDNLRLLDRTIDTRFRSLTSR